MIGVRRSDDRVGFAGLVTCGSVWACPVCGSKILARRALEIGAVVAGAAAEGSQVVFGTFTMRHNRGQALAALWGALGAAWKRVTTGAKWESEREQYGRIGFVRVVETTHGDRNGWHVHVHFLLVLENGCTAADVDELLTSMWDRWSSGLQRAGMAAPLLKASEWHVVTGGDVSGTKLGEYLSKGVEGAAAIGMELTQTQSKIARSVHSTDSVWTLLQRGAEWGETVAIRLWWEWEKASKGKRQIAWSRGLRERYGLRVEQTDEDIAAEEVGSQADTVVFISRAGWGEVIRRCMNGEPGFQAVILDQAEALDTEAFSAWLWAEGIEHRRA